MASLACDTTPCPMTTRRIRWCHISHKNQRPHFKHPSRRTLSMPTRSPSLCAIPLGLYSSPRKNDGWDHARFYGRSCTARMRFPPGALSHGDPIPVIRAFRRAADITSRVPSREPSVRFTASLKARHVLASPDQAKEESGDAGAHKWPRPSETARALMVAATGIMRIYTKNG